MSCSHNGQTAVVVFSRIFCPYCRSSASDTRSIVSRWDTNLEYAS